jgi:thiamine biosynthesis lipoprotein
MSIAEMIIPELHRGARSRPGDPRSEAESQAFGWTAHWSAWGTTASVTVTDPGVLSSACRLVRRQFAAAEKAAARFRPDAELHRLYRAGGRPITVSPLLAELISAALTAAERTDGDVDPTVAAAMTAVHGSPGRGRDTSSMPVCATRPTAGRPPIAGWQQVDLQGRRLRVPPGTTLDLSATATALACDLAAARVRDRLRTGVLVTLGGDAASAGPAPADGWRVPIEDRAGVRRTEVRLSAGAGLATSHFTARMPFPEANSDVPAPGHLIDPGTGLPPAVVWRMATAIGFSSLEAATYTAASLVRGTSARAWLGQLWVPARLVTVYDDVVTVGPWSSHEPTTGTTDGPSSPDLPSPRLANPLRTTR